MLFRSSSISSRYAKASSNISASQHQPIPSPIRIRVRRSRSGSRSRQPRNSLQKEEEDLQKKVVDYVNKDNEEEKMLSQAVEFISQDLVSTISQVIKKLQKKEEENGKVHIKFLKNIPNIMLCQTKI